MKLFKKKTTRDGKTFESAKWYISLDRKHVPLHTNRKVSETMATQLLARKAEGKLGVVVTSHDDERRKSLADLLPLWSQSLTLKGSGERHVKVVAARVRAVVHGCGFVRATDLDGDRAYGFVANLDLSAQTKNFYLKACQQFARWLIRKGVLQANPFADLDLWDVRRDRRHDRREPTDEELLAVISTTEGENVTRGKMSGIDRAMMYRVALMTGFRASELAAITPGDIDLDAGVIVLRGEFTKNGEDARQEIPAELTAILSAWLGAKPRDLPVWGGKWAKNCHGGVEMLQKDLKAAKVPYKTAAGFFDMHSFRHAFISRLVRGGVNLNVCKSLARHSTIELTANRYSHLQPGERKAAVGTLSLPGRGCKSDANGDAKGDQPQGNVGNGAGAVAVSKTDLPARVTRVRIPPSPLGTLENKGYPQSQTHSSEGTEGKETDANGTGRMQIGCKLDPQLAAVLRAWPALPDHLKHVVLAVVSPFLPPVGDTSGTTTSPSADDRLPPGYERAGDGA